ncbi:rho guanine nucleotide exchange factor 33 [Brachionichthys hirsutus]|uniref:rho guanine nucleotide exchange factor 33 n=1 Tax=Brachionichthys hirsutus TaxID=412623 RepID=UPI003604F359
MENGITEREEKLEGEAARTSDEASVWFLLLLPGDGRHNESDIMSVELKDAGYHLFLPLDEYRVENMEEAHLEVAQLQSLVAELQEGLHGALTELRQLQRRNHGVEEKLQAHQTDVDDKVMGLKNSLNTFKEELNAALLRIKDVSSRQQEVQRRIELLRAGEDSDAVFSVARRRSSDAEVLPVTEDESVCASDQPDLSLPQTGSSQTTPAVTQTSTPEQPRGRPSKPPAWIGKKNGGRDEIETRDSPTELSNRQKVALDLLESERVYVSNLSLLLKANISFNGSEALTCQDKRPFPSSLRFLIQQHLELLHTLQERVLKSQWQSIVGDVFMRLTSAESEFLDFYVSYLKELPECLSVISMLATANSVASSGFVESDVIGDESKPSLRNLLLQPVQRIPEYLLRLQGLLKQTEADHPDYYLLVVCMQQFRVFTTQYHRLLQHNQELLLLNRERYTMKQLLRSVESGIQANNIGLSYPRSGAVLEHANQVKRSKQHLLEQIQSHRFQNWEQDQDSESQCYDIEQPSQLSYFSPDLDSRNHKLTGLGSIPENEGSDRSVSCQHHQPSRPADGRQVQPGSALADALGEFLLPPDPSGLESFDEEDRGSFHDVAGFDHPSSASSDSSIDIAFVKFPKGPPAAHHATAVNVTTARDVGRNHRKKIPKSGYMSPDELIIMHHNHHRPLQASQRKSKSLNGLPMDSMVSSLDVGLLPEHFQKVGVDSHAKLERQGSKGSKGCATPSRRVQSPTGSRTDSDKQSDELHGLLSIVMRSTHCVPSNQDPGFQSWGEESNWRGGTEEFNHTPLSERSRKQDKGGFRSSFKKLFKKKSSEKKEKGGGTTSENQNDEEPEAPVVHVEINRGTAV